MLSFSSMRLWAMLFTIALWVEASAVHLRDLAQRTKMALIQF